MPRLKNRPGAKRQKVTSASSVRLNSRTRDCEPENDSRPEIAKIEKGPYIDPKNPYEYPGETPQFPLTLKAVSLLSQHIRQAWVWRAVKTLYMDLEFAANTLLGVQKPRAKQVLNELDRDGGPHGWLRAKFVEAIKDGSIRPGIETEPSKIADLLFSELAGGWDEVAIIRQRLGPESRVQLKEATKGMRQVDSHVALYFGLRGYFTPET
jgi:hypothetical protein